MRALVLSFLLVSAVSAQALEPAAPVHVHANADHPAVAVARLAKSPTIDANTYLVQPPASVRWTVPPVDVKVLAQVPQTVR
jgi:hypothetical protein